MDNRSNISRIALSAYTPHSYAESENRRGWINYGVNNDYPDYLVSLYNESPTHRALVRSIAYYIYGAGFAPSALDNYDFNKTLLKSLVEYKIHGYFFLEVVFAGSQIRDIYHMPTEAIRCGKRVGRQVPNYWYSEDWSNVTKYKPIELATFNPSRYEEHPRQILAVRPFSPGSFYYPLPDYNGAVEYCELERRISTFHNSAIKNGLAPSYIIKMKNGQPDPEQQMMIERNIQNQLVGESNAGNVLIFYTEPGGDTPDVDTVQLSDADKQYQFLSEECTKKIIQGHGVVSPMLFGVRDGSGFSSNADELREADRLMRQNIIDPVRDIILDNLQPLFSALNITSITWQDKSAPTTIIDDPANKPNPQLPAALAKHNHSDDDGNAMADYLQGVGEDIDEDEWELIDIRPEEYDNDIEKALSVAMRMATKLASVPSSNPNGLSEQDNELFKVRYTYAPKQTDSGGSSRSFCRKMVASNKVYRKEDIEAASDRAVNPGFGPGGSNTYDLWLYKGGPNCYHFWERRVYLRRNNKKITVGEARKIISELSPSQRDAARLPQNDSDVARRPIDMPNHGYLNPPNA